MASNPVPPLPAQLEYLRPGRNALETSIELGQSWTRNGKPYMLFDTVKRVLKALDDNGIPYAVIGGLAVSHHAIPRLTQDVDIAILAQDAAKVHAIFPGCYVKGTAVVEVYEIEGTRVDFLPAKLRHQRAAVENAVDGLIEQTPAKIASVHDLLLLKMLAAPDRPELAARRADEADITALLQVNVATVTAEDIRYVCERLLELCFTVEEREKTSRQIAWLNDTLDQLGMADRMFDPPS